MKLSLLTTVRASFGLAVLVAITIGIVAFLRFQSFHTQNQWVIHTYQVINVSERLLSSLKDIETGQRGYLMSNNTLYLESYLYGLDSLPRYIKRLKQLTNDNPAQQRRIIEMQKAIDQLLVILQEGINYRQNQEMRLLEEYIAAGHNRVQMDLIRGYVAQITDVENKLLKERTHARERENQYLEWIVYSVVLVAMLIAVLSFLYIHHQLKVKDAHEKALYRLNLEVGAANEEMTALNEELITSGETLTVTNYQLTQLTNELESRVNERTAELQKTLVQLTSEVEYRRHTELALRESEERFRLALQSAPLVIARQDQQLRYTWIFNSQKGLKLEDIVGKTDAELLTADEATELNRIKQHVLHTGESRREEITIHNQGTTLHLLLTVEALWENNTITGIIWSAVNITDQKQIQHTLEQTLKELQTRNYELDQYVYKVSHDLRAPLTSILGLIQLMEMEDVPEQIKHYLKLVNTRILKADQYIQSVLTHSQTLNLTIEPVEIDFKALISECSQELQYMPGADSISLHMDVQSTYPFYSDIMQITALLKNFYSNAIKYQDKYKPDAYVSFTIRITSDHAEIRIQDNGIGIDPVYQDRIFTMFFRATEKAEGSGLGLYIVHQIVEKLGGTMNLESQPGQGTLFTITLPNLST